MSKHKKLLHFDGFSIHLLEDEQGEFIAHFVEMPSVSACGDTAEEAIAELKIAWEAMKASYRKHGHPIPIAPTQKIYTGQFKVHVDKRIHRALAIEAARVGISLNTLIAQKLLQSIEKQIDTDI